jgi:hypothetical protein
MTSKERGGGQIVFSISPMANFTPEINDSKIFKKMVEAKDTNAIHF